MVDKKVKSTEVRDTEIRRCDAGLHESIDVADSLRPRWLSRILPALLIDLSQHRGRERVTYVMRGSAAKETPWSKITLFKASFRTVSHLPLREIHGASLAPSSRQMSLDQLSKWDQVAVGVHEVTSFTFHGERLIMGIW